MKRAAPHAELLDFHALWALAREAGAWVRGDPVDDDEEPSEAGHRELARRSDAGLETWRFVAAAAADRAEARMLPLVRWMMHVAKDTGRERLCTMEGIEAALAHVGRRAHEHPEALAVLLEDPRTAVRSTLAQALDPSVPEARAAMARLAGDASGYVRRIARGRLARDGVTLPWWHGLSSEDPERALHTETERAALAALRALFAEEHPSRDEATPEAVREWLDALPGPVAIDIAGAIARGRWPGALGDQPLLAMLARGASNTAIRAVLRAWGGAHWYRATELAQAASPAQRMALSLLMIAEIREPPVGLRGPYVRRLRDSLIMALDDVWPGGDADQEPLLVLVLDGPVATASERARSPLALWSVSNRLVPGHPTLARHDAAIRAAVVAKLPGAWAALPYGFAEHYRRPPRAVARASARRALGSGDPREIERAAEELLGALHEPSEDPPVPQLARTFYDDPRTRAAVLTVRGAMDAALLQRARRALGRGELSAVEAARALTRLASADELAEPTMREDPLLRRPRLPSRPKLRPADWQAFRAARDAASLGTLDADAHALIASTLPAGRGLDAADAPVVRGAIARLLDAGEEPLLYVLVVLTGKRDPDVDAEIDASVSAILSRTGDEAVALVRGLVESARFWDFPGPTLARLAACRVE